MYILIGLIILVIYMGSIFKLQSEVQKVADEMVSLKDELKKLETSNKKYISLNKTLTQKILININYVK